MELPDNGQLSIKKQYFPYNPFHFSCHTSYITKVYFTCDKVNSNPANSKFLFYDGSYKKQSSPVLSGNSTSFGKETLRLAYDG